MAAATGAPITSLSRVLTPKGYAVRKDRLTAEQTEQLLKELTVKPKVLETYAKGIKPFPIYMESPTRYYVPRQWGIATYGKPEATTIGDGTALPAAVKFKGTPYDYQEAIIAQFVGAGANGLICVPCGRGKTFMALAIAMRLGRRFLIVVDKEFLMNQWKGEIEAYVSGCRVGIIQGDKLQTDAAAYDCTICMIQTICQREFPAGCFEEYGFTIFDECHHLGAQHFSGALRKIQTRYMLGLSATPDRDDGLTKVFEYFLGKAVYEERTREPDPTVVVRAIWYKNEDPAYADVPVNWRGEPVTARLLTQVVECVPRTERVLAEIRELAADKNRQILVLSERKAHLEAIAAGLADEAYLVGYYVGGMKQEVLDSNAATCQILLGTYAMASEAMNIKTLNTMIMASPRKKIEQSTGRILRTRPENRKVDPVIVDVIDQHDMYVRQWWQRARYYKKCAYVVEHDGRPSREPAAGGAGRAEPVAEHCMIQLGAGADSD